MENENAKAVLKLFKVTFHIFSIRVAEYEKMPKEVRIDHPDTKKIFYTIDSIVKVLYKASKDKKNDDVFVDEQAISDLLAIVDEYFLKKQHILVELT